MQFKQTLVRLVLLFFPLLTFSQTTYLPQGAKENILLERLEIKSRTDSVLNFSKIKPFSRAYIIPHIQRLDSLTRLSRVDAYNLYTAQLSNIEYALGERNEFASKKTFLNHFYKTPANFYEVNTKDFFLAINPVLQLTVGKESDNDETLFQNSRGITLRGRIAEKIGFAAYVTENQERDPLYVQQWETERDAVPGHGYYRNFKGNGYDYFDARGYFTFNVTKYIDVAFGYDRNFIGSGQRSLYLSDFANNTLFLKLNTRIWKFNYQNLFMELVSAERNPNVGDKYLGKKYAAIHHLDLAVTRWLNIGLFEAVVFGRKNRFEFGYLNPVIFYRSAELENGSFDNAMAGLDVKANIAGHFQLYGQLLLDEFKLNELKKKWWANKFGIQAGAKYIDAFGVSNLDLQVEMNRVRPFTYSHSDSVANYTHQNQPLAHPLGANFNEVLGIVRFQPAPKWLLQAKAIYMMQGKDTGSTSFGGNIFLPSSYRRMDYGYETGGGIKSKVGYASFLASFELKPNFFIEANAVMRNQNANLIQPERNSFIFSAGIRWNMHRRDFEF